MCCAPKICRQLVKLEAEAGGQFRSICSQKAFQLVMMYLYSGGQPEVIDDHSLSLQFELMDVALRFCLETLKCEITRRIKLLIKETTVAEIFPFATVS